MRFNLYEEFPWHEVSRGAGRVLYDAPLTRLVGTGDVLRLITAVASPPSWLDSTGSELPCFRGADYLDWDSEARYWAEDVARFERFEWDEVRGKGLELFITARDDVGKSCFFVGMPRGGSFGRRGPETYSSSFWLKPRLPKELWIRFGGYGGWLMTVGDEEFHVGGYDDAAPILAAKWRPGANLVVTRYEGDVLNAYVNAQGEAVVTYLRDNISPQEFSGRFDPEDELVTLEARRCDEVETPRSTVISRDAALQIVRLYLSTGVPGGVRPA